jgi:hypothetical protein
MRQSGHTLAHWQKDADHEYTHAVAKKGSDHEYTHAISPVAAAKKKDSDDHEYTHTTPAKKEKARKAQGRPLLRTLTCVALAGK